MTAQSHQQLPKTKRTRIVERVTTKTLKCGECTRELPLDDFPIIRKRGHRVYKRECLTCNRLLSNKQSNALHESGLTNIRVRDLRKYGLTPDRYLELLHLQGNACAICQTSFEDMSPRVDHCHTTKVVRGLLCHHCNSMLGYAKDNQQTLTRAVAYLEKNSPDFLG